MKKINKMLVAGWNFWLVYNISTVGLLLPLTKLEQLDYCLIRQTGKVCGRPRDPGFTRRMVYPLYYSGSVSASALQ